MAVILVLGMHRSGTSMPAPALPDSAPSLAATR
jgi:hypothetical protein